MGSGNGKTAEQVKNKSPAVSFDGRQAGQGAKYVKANRKGSFTYLQANYTTQRVKEKARSYTISCVTKLHNTNTQDYYTTPGRAGR